MNTRILFVTVFIITQPLLLGLYITAYNQAIELSYAAQKLEREIEQLKEHKQQSQHTLYELQNSTHIQKYARDVLALQSIQLSQIHKLNIHDVHA